MTTKEQNKLSRMILYDQIHRYHAERKSARWIADRLKINPRTVKKYLSMSQAEFERHSDNINRKGFALPGLPGSIPQDRLQLCDEDTSGTWSAGSERIGAAIQLHS